MNEDMIGLAIFFGGTLFLLFLGLTVGTTVDLRHRKDLTRREAELSNMLITDLKSFPGGAEIGSHATMVMGQVVIGSDYLKTFLAKLRNIFGGEVGSFVSLMERARREALLRMMQEAQDRGYDAVCNVRYETSNIGAAMGRRGMAMVEVFVYGTAYRPTEHSS